MPLALGPFDLHAPVARGGTAEVWQAIHRTQGMPVAVKVVTIDLVDERAFRARFAREVQSMAQLRHPAVARIFDYGEVDPALSRASQGRLPVRASWLAMEWLGGGSLDVATVYEWPVLRATLLTLLDALAHAHAHAVIHLDLKPDNVLLAERGPVLTDFGLAFSSATRQSFRDHQVFGTPGYMAPEQIHSQWRDFGPWTDLYALGCLAYELVCGHVPHGAGDPGPLPLMMAHVTEPLPPPDARMALPAGFHPWLTRLLARDPAERFRFAADAAVALLALPGDPTAVSPDATDSFESIAEAMGSVEWISGDTSLNRDPQFAETVDGEPDAFDGHSLRRTPYSSMPPPLAFDPAPTPSAAFAAIDTFVEPPEALFSDDLPFEPTLDAGGSTEQPAPQPPLGAADMTAEVDPPAEITDSADTRLAVEETADARELLAALGSDADPALRETVGLLETAEMGRLDLADLRSEWTRTDPSMALVETGEMKALTSAPPSPLRPEPLLARPSGYGAANRTLVMGPVFLPIEDTSWSAGPTAAGRPPIPSTWARQAPIPPPPLLDAGEALVRLRTPAPVGREAERDQLWAELTRAAAGETRLVLVEGPAGQGKTHLAKWICRRAHELGVADQITVHHAASADETSGVAPALVQHLRLQELDHRERLDRIRALTGEELDPEASRAFAASLVREREVHGVTNALVIQSEAELDAARAGGLIALSRRRPIVLHLDDVQWGWTSIRFALHLLDHHPAAPLLIVATVRDDALRPGSLERDMVARLTAHARTHRIALGPLDADELTGLVTSLLPVEPRLTAALVQRTHGNPLFAVELMRHWIGQGALVPGPDGFRLARRELIDALPRSQHAVWTARVSHVLRRAEPEAAHAFELAAVLGPVVAHGEWALACAAVGTQRPREGFRRMVDERLVRPQSDGRWTFGNAMLREVFLQRARDGGRWTRWHGACADVLARDAAVDPGRLLHHLAEAGRHKEALPPALDLADRQLDRGGHVDAEGTLLEAAGMLRRIRQPLGSRPWVEISLRWSHACVARGQIRRALRRAERCLEATRQSGNPHLRGRVLLAHARALDAAGRPEAALRALQDATRAADQSGDRRLSARVRNAAGRSLNELGRLEQARQALTAALHCLGGLHAPRLKGDALHHLADMARRAGNPRETRAHARTALELYRKLGARRQQGQVELLIGDSLRHDGRPDEAAEHYRTARRLLRATASAEAPVADLDLALVLLDLGQYHDARPMLEAVAEEAAGPDARSRALPAMAHAYLLSCAAAARDWAEWDARAAPLAALSAGEVVDPELAHALRLGGRLAHHAGQTDRARQAIELAVHQFEALGRTDDALALRYEVGL